MATAPLNDPMPDLDSVEPLSASHPPGQDADFRAAHQRARKYLESHKWVSAIEQEYLGAAFNGIIYILLFKIRPAQAGVDSWIWVIVGDIPPAYITCDECKTPAEALDGYIGAMIQWVEAALEGRSVADLIPVNVPPTREYAEMLKSRLQFLDQKIMPMLEGEEE